MTEQSTRAVDQPTSEILATSGLLTMLGAVVAAVIGLVSLSQGDLGLAVILGAVALVVFGVSLGCFFLDSNRAEEEPLPFPSWLRRDAVVAAELVPAPAV